MELRLRRATPADAAALAAVEVASWRAAYRGMMPDAFLDALSEAEKTAHWRENLLKHGQLGRKRVVVALVDERIIGFVRVGAEHEDSEAGLVYLLYVLPEYWRRGVGRRLISAALDELRDLGLSYAMLWVLRDNQRARRFYEMQGWLEDGRASIDRYGDIELEARRYRRTVDG
jgi:ribosomal protein S18 acetylase RimI-like enzyme